MIVYCGLNKSVANFFLCVSSHPLPSATETEVQIVMVIIHRYVFGNALHCKHF